MNLKLNYKITDLEERKQIVNQICNEHVNELSPRNLEVLADYLIDIAEKEEKKAKKILTQNRLSTINKRETSLQRLTSKFEHGEDGVYQLMNREGNKNKILSPSVKITRKDLVEIPFLQELREGISILRLIPDKNYIIQQAIIDLSQTQYLIKNSYRRPIQFTKILPSQRVNVDWDHILDLTKKDHIAGLLKNYSRLKTKVYYELDNNLHWILIDLDNIIKQGLEVKYPILYDIMIWKIDGLNNLVIQEMLLEKYDKTYSIEYISTLFNNKIPKIIANDFEIQHLLWYYTNIEIGKWKKCNRCGQIKLLHSKFFSKNSSNKNGFYSICKDCRKKKRGVE